MTAIKKRLQKMPADKREVLIRNLTPRIVEPYIAHIPHPKQQVFLTLQCREAMYGGAAGGGKSDAVLMSALQYVDVPGYSALILRRTWPDLNAPGAILDRARTWLKPTDARERDGGRMWEFPSGAKLQFGYMGRDADKYKYQSAEYQFIGFDELTHFEESSYTYMFSRLRRPKLTCLNCGNQVRRYKAKKVGWVHASRSAGPRCSQVFPDPKVLRQYPEALDGLSIFDVPLRMRSATNPGGIGHEWVSMRLVDPKTREKGAIFLPARLADNPSLDQEEYRESLSHLSVLDRQRLEDGDWSAIGTGNVFQRTWWHLTDTPRREERERLVRYWDMAGTDGGGDYTASCLMAALPDGTFEIRDIWRGQVAGAHQERVVRTTAQADGPSVRVYMEQEPGSSGKNIISHYARNVLQGYAFEGDKVTGSKTDRSYPLAVAAERGDVRIVIGNNTRDFLNEADAFPEGGNDDMVDACSGAFAKLSLGARARLIV
ncbi:terminase [Gordonia phage DalanDe]|nr:terminase [Gordonia phage DalanDe]